MTLIAKKSFPCICFILIHVHKRTIIYRDLLHGWIQRVFVRFNRIPRLQTLSQPFESTFHFHGKFWINLEYLIYLRYSRPLLFFTLYFSSTSLQSTLVISTSLISNNRLYRSEILVPVFTWKSKNR